MAVTVSTIRRIRDVAGVDLGAIVAFQPGGAAAKMADAPVLAARVIYAVVEPEAERRGVTEDAFLDSLAGDCLEQACFALLDALTDFFPKAQATLLRRAVPIGREEQQRTQAVAEEMAARMDAASPSSSSPANTRESSDATPAR